MNILNILVFSLAILQKHVFAGYETVEVTAFEYHLANIAISHIDLIDGIESQLQSVTGAARKKDNFSCDDQTVDYKIKTEIKLGNGEPLYCVNHLQMKSDCTEISHKNSKCGNTRDIHKNYFPSASNFKTSYPIFKNDFNGSVEWFSSSLWKVLNDTIQNRIGYECYTYVSMLDNPIGREAFANQRQYLVYFEIYDKCNKHWWRNCTASVFVFEDINTSIAHTNLAYCAWDYQGQYNQFWFPDQYEKMEITDFEYDIAQYVVDRTPALKGLVRLPIKIIGVARKQLYSTAYSPYDYAIKTDITLQNGALFYCVLVIEIDEYRKTVKHSHCGNDRKIQSDYFPDVTYVNIPPVNEYDFTRLRNLNYSDNRWNRLGVASVDYYAEIKRLPNCYRLAGVTDVRERRNSTVGLNFHFQYFVKFEMENLCENVSMSCISSVYVLPSRPLPNETDIVRANAAYCPGRNDVDEFRFQYQWLGFKRFA